MQKRKNIIHRLVLVAAVLISLTVGLPSVASANPVPVKDFALSQCGSGTDKITTSINFGCDGAVCVTNPSASYCSGNHDALMDLMFALIRLLSDGVGLVIIASLILAGIQYTFSRGDPQSVKSATKRIQSTATALIVFIFAYALLNYIIPNGILGQ